MPTLVLLSGLIDGIEKGVNVQKNLHSRINHQQVARSRGDQNIDCRVFIGLTTILRAYL